MSITAGALSIVSVGYNTVQLAATAATGGTGPYTYQWYVDTQSGFSPSGANIIAGATSLTLTQSNRIPGSVYYYKVIATDTGHSNDTVTYTQLEVDMLQQGLSQNQFVPTTVVGNVQMPYNTNTIPVLVDASQASPLYAGMAVKVVDSAGGPPKVVACDADSDECFGFINFDQQNVSFPALAPANLSQESNVIYLYATGAIARGAQVCLDVSSPASVQSVSDASTGDNIVGWAFDKASAYGDLIRVRVLAPSYAAKP